MLPKTSEDGISVLLSLAYIKSVLYMLLYIRFYICIFSYRTTENYFLSEAKNSWWNSSNSADAARKRKEKRGNLLWKIRFINDRMADSNLSTLSIRLLGAFWAQFWLILHSLPWFQYRLKCHPVRPKPLCIVVHTALHLSVAQLQQEHHAVRRGGLVIGSTPRGN